MTGEHSAGSGVVFGTGVLLSCGESGSGLIKRSKPGGDEMGLVRTGFTVVVRVQGSGLLGLSETTDLVWTGWEREPVDKKIQSGWVRDGLVRKVFTGAVRVRGSGFVQLPESPDRAWARVKRVSMAPDRPGSAWTSSSPCRIAATLYARPKQVSLS